MQTDMWNSHARGVATAVPSLDYLGWHGEHYVVVRSSGDANSGCGASSSTSGAGTESVEIKELPARRRLDCLKGVDLGSEDAAWLERIDVPMDYELPGVE